MRFKTVTIGLLAAYFAAVIAVGFWPDRVDTAVRADILQFVETARSSGFVYMSYDLVDALANVVWFIPIGMLTLLMMSRRLWMLALLTCCALSCIVEVVQGMALPERVGSVSDVVANSMGALIGILIGVIIDQARHLRRRTRGRLGSPAGESDAVAPRGGTVSTTHEAPALLG